MSAILSSSLLALQLFEQNMRPYRMAVTPVCLQMMPAVKAKGQTRPKSTSPVVQLI